MKKIWEMREKFPESFKLENKKYGDVVLQLLWNRGIKNKKAIKEFLEPDFTVHTHNPFLFNDMEAATALIIKHIKAKNKILVYGDYDADGVTSSALLKQTLGALKARVDVHIPHRVTEGYGLNKKSIKDIAAQGNKLIITVDTGIRSKEEIALAQKLGIEVVLTDHHIPPEKKEDYPNCLIINSAILEEKYPFKKLAGVGVAYKLAKALISKSNLDSETKEKLEQSILDLVAIGTVTDCVSLTKENRVLVKFGLKEINKIKRVGLKKLIDISGLNKGQKLDSWNLGFQIGPRLNAAGRMGSANTAFRLLISKDQKEARNLASQLNQKNISRQDETKEIFKQAEKQINSNDKVIVALSTVVDKNNAWNEGIIGLVASRITNKYYRPSLVITKSENGFKGSARSIPEFSIIAAIEKCAELLTRYGGHPGACGFSLESENLDKFMEKIRKITKKELEGKDLRPKILIEVELELDLADEELAQKINSFSPFGQENARPILVSRNVQVLDIFTMGADNNHIKLRVKDNNSSVLSAIGFSQAEKWQHLKIGEKIDIVYNLEINEFNGRRNVQLKIVDIQMPIAHNL